MQLISNIVTNESHIPIKTFIIHNILSIFSVSFNSPSAISEVLTSLFWQHHQDGDNNPGDYPANGINRIAHPSTPRKTARNRAETQN